MTISRSCVYTKSLTLTTYCGPKLRLGVTAPKILFNTSITLHYMKSDNIYKI